MRKSFKIILSLTLLVGVLVSGCSFKRDPVALYKTAVDKTNSITAAETLTNLDIEVTASGNTKITKITSNMTEDYKQKKSSGKVQVLKDGKSSEVEMYNVGDSAYVKIPKKERYLKSNASQVPLYKETAQKYSAKILEIFNSNAGLTKNVTMVEDKDRNKLISFKIPTDRTKEMVQNIIMGAVLNKDIKKNIADQVIAGAKEKYKDKKVSDEEIKKAVDEQMHNMNKTIENAFKEVDFDVTQYIITINKKGYIEEQVLNIGFKTKTGEKVALKLVRKLKNINEKVNVNIPEINQNNTEESSFLNQVFMDAFK